MITATFLVLLITASLVRSNGTNETEQAKVLANFSLGSFLPPVSKITLPKLPAIPKRNTITLTTTILTQETRYAPIYPTCIQLQNVQSICKGYVETIIPTPILPTTVLWRDSQSIHDEEMVERRIITPSSTRFIQPTATLDSLRINIIEPSEHEYEYTRPDDITPIMREKSQLDSSIEERSKTGNFLESLLGPKYEICTAHLTVTKVIHYTDNFNKATVIATNCIPPGIQYPLCDPSHINPFYPYAYQNKKKQKINQTIRQTVDKIYQHIDKFILSNPYGFLGISPEGSGHFYGALNSNAIPSILRTAELFPVERSIDDGITGESS